MNQQVLERESSGHMHTLYQIISYLESQSRVCSAKYLQVPLFLEHLPKHVPELRQVSLLLGYIESVEAAWDGKNGQRPFIV